MNELATLETLHKIEQSKLAIREVKNLDEIKTLIDQSEALKAYAKSAQLSAEIQADIAELNRRATRRLGEISAALEKAKCERTDLYRRTVEVSNSNTEKISKTAMLSSVGVDIRRANEAEKIASIPEDVFDGILKSSKSGVSKADIAELAKIEPERQKAVAEKLAAGESASIAEAQRKLQQEESARKQSEEQQAHARVSAYLKTGKKPEGWREGTDDKLAQEEQKRQARVDAVFAEARKKQEERQAEDQKYEEDIARLRAEREKAQAEYAKERTEGFNTESLETLMKQQMERQEKRLRFKERIRLSAEGRTDPFQDALIDYLDSLADDNRRIEACYNIIKICKGIANNLQVSAGNKDKIE
jgi:hypothetical protein